MKKFNGLTCILTYILALIFISSINSVYNVDNQIILILENILILSFLIFKFYDDLNHDLKEFKPKQAVFKNFKYYIICFILMFITNYILTKCLGSIASNEKLNRMLIKSKPIYALTSLILISPICEEIVFRLSFKNFKGSDKFKIVLTSIVFALIHILLSFKNVYSFLYIFPYFFLGLAFGIIYFKEKNIYASILFHSFHNLISIIVIIISSGKL